MAATGGRPRGLLRRPAPDARTLLLVLPYAGSGASTLHRWPRRVGDAEVCPVQFPGREDRLLEPHHGTYEQLVAALTESLAPVLDRPFALFGHCDSALIALEWAVALCEAGARTPERVFASSMFSPAATDRAPILHMDDAALGGMLADMARARGGAMAPELADMALRVMRHDVEAFRAYRPGPLERYTCPVTVIGWESDDMIPPGETDGWEPYGGGRRVVLPGGHWAFLDAPPVLLAELARDLTREGQPA